MNTRFSRFVILAVGLSVGFFVAKLTTPSPQPEHLVEKNKLLTKTKEQTNFFANENIKTVVKLSHPRLDLGPQTGRLWGTITTTEGKPLAAVRVIGTLRLRFPKIDDMAMNDFMDLSRLHYEKIQASLSQSISDASGNYQLEHLLDGNYTLKVELPGWRFKGARHFGSLNNIEINREFNLIASRMKELLVDVRLPGGAQALKANLKIKRSESHPNFTYADRTHKWTPEKNVLKLPPGQYSITASNQHLASEEGSATLSLEEVDQLPLVLDLAGRSGIRGRVILGTGFGDIHMSMLRVSYMAFEGQAPNPSTLRPGHDQTQYMTGRKTYSFYDLPEGSYIVWARSTYQGAVEASAILFVKKGEMVSKDLTLILDKKAITITARVRGPNGLPLKNVKFKAGYASFQILKQQQETYSILLPAHFVNQLKNKGQNNFSLHVSHNSYGRQTLTVEIGGEVNVIFKFPGTLLLHIQGYEAAKHRDLVKIQIKNSQDSDYFDSHGAKVPDLNGEVTFENISPGDYRITLGIKSRSYRFMTPVKETIAVSSGQNTYTLSMPALYSVTLTGLKNRTPLSLSLGIDFSYSSVIRSATSLNGEATFRNLPEGEYMVKVGNIKNIKYMTFQLPGSSTVSFEPLVFNAFKLTFEDNDHPLAEAGFVDGDLITAIDGTELKNLAQIRALRSLHDVKVRGLNKDQNYSLRMTLQRGEIIEMKARLFVMLSRYNGQIRPSPRR